MGGATPGHQGANILFWSRCLPQSIDSIPGQTPSQKLGRLRTRCKREKSKDIGGDVVTEPASLVLFLGSLNLLGRLVNSLAVRGLAAR